MNIKSTWKKDNPLVPELKRIAKITNWSNFKSDAESKLKECGKDYKIKKALREAT